MRYARQNRSRRDTHKHHELSVKPALPPSYRLKRSQLTPPCYYLCRCARDGMYNEGTSAVGHCHCGVRFLLRFRREILPVARVSYIVGRSDKLEGMYDVSVHRHQFSRFFVPSSMMFEGTILVTIDACGLTLSETATVHRKSIKTPILSVMSQ